jgi:hypothetical protein
MTNVIDVNAYVGDWPFRPLRHSRPASLRRALEAVGITRALVSPLAAIFRQECQSANAELLRALRAHGGFFAPVPAINPSYSGWEDDVQAALRARAPGVRLFPNYHAYSLDDPAARGAVAQAAASGLAVFLSLRMQDERHHHPRMMVPAVPADEVVRLARALPEARIVACMARYAEAETLLAPNRNAVILSKAPSVSEAQKRSSPASGGNLGRARRKVQEETQPGRPTGGVFLDLSGIQGPVACVDLLAERFGAERLLMGTGAPLQYALPGVAKIHACELPAAVRDGILGGNAASLLGLGKKCRLGQPT